MYLLAVFLHCFAATVIAGACAAQSGIFRHAVVSVGLGVGASAALKKVSGYTLALLPRLPVDEGQDHGNAA
jgi:hypothetical protein